MSLTMTSAPSCASRTAMARPKPRSPPAPVTSATLPERSYIAVSPKSARAAEFGGAF